MWGRSISESVIKTYVINTVMEKLLGYCGPAQTGQLKLSEFECGRGREGLPGQHLQSETLKVREC